MHCTSIFNDVLGPVMRGPSSSHTAGSYHIARIGVDLLGARPRRARVAFDPAGSYAQVYREQGVDRAFAVGLLGWALTDLRFLQALDRAPAAGLDLAFEVRALNNPDHPNTAEIELVGDANRSVSLTARSVGGGAVEVTRVGGWPVRLTGATYDVLVESAPEKADDVRRLLGADGQLAADVESIARDPRRDRAVLLHARRTAALAADAVSGIDFRSSWFRQVRPLAFVKRGQALFSSAAEMIAVADGRAWSLGQVALAHEASVLGLTEAETGAEMERRLNVMTAAVAEGLGEREPVMQLLQPSARGVFEKERRGELPTGGLHTRAAARALAVMHVNASMGVVCAAPTGGSAGVIPAVVATLLETRPDKETAIRALFAAAAIGVVVASRATFAAEVAGCQVEIGAAGAMAAAAVVEAAGGSAAQAADAAAIAFQNTMGSVCDLVQGMVEIPCHTRNAVAASSAFVCADLVLGGYRNPVPLDETVDAVLAVGRMLPSELRCTARGGLAVTPSALKLHKWGRA